MKPKLISSFSGGRTSAYMTKMLLENYSDKFDIHVTFANTGQEHDKTLEFIDKCDREWNFKTVWLEAVVNETHGEGTKHKIVSFETASRDGKPYRDVIKKYGLPNIVRPFCTREMKNRVIKSYMRESGLLGEVMAIGIRVDELRRVNQKEAKANNIIYPLADWFPTIKPQILQWFESQPFDLEIKEYEGNCKWCFKKSLNKLIKLARENPAFFDFPREMEALYSNVGPEDDAYKPRKFFRGNRTVDDIFKLAHDDLAYKRNIAEIASEDAIVRECDESCEPFQTEMMYGTEVA